jgi:hypothetical protein
MAWVRILALPSSAEANFWSSLNLRFLLYETERAAGAHQSAVEGEPELGRRREYTPAVTGPEERGAGREVRALECHLGQAGAGTVL